MATSEKYVLDLGEAASRQDNFDGSTENAIKDPSAMSIKELKLELTSAGLGSELARCNEKAELVALLQSHRQGEIKEDNVEAAYAADSLDEDDDDLRAAIALSLQSVQIGTVRIGTDSVVALKSSSPVVTPVTGAFEMRGVTLKLLRALVRVARLISTDVWSVGRVSAVLLGNHEILKEGHRWGAVDPKNTITYEHKLSLIDLLKTYHKDASCPHPTLGVCYDEVVGEKATRFVSFAYNCDFFEIIDSIEDYVAANPDSADESNTYFWFDMIVNNQWFALDHDFAWWSTTFKEAIGNIGHILLMCVPWDNPLPLTRAWCCWEIFCGYTTHSKLSILLGKSQELDFFRTLCEESGKLMDAFCKLDVEKASCWLASDRVSIFEAINANGGVAGINNSISSMMRSWFKEQAERLLTDSKIASFGLENGVDAAMHAIRPFENMCTVGYVYDELHEFEKAVSYYERGIEGMKEVIGVHNRFTISWMQRLCQNYNQLQRLDDAKALRHELNEILASLDHSATGISSREERHIKFQVRLNEGSSACMESRFGDAVRLFSEVIRDMENEGEEADGHLIFQLGMAYQGQGKMDLALDFIQKAIDATPANDVDHPVFVQMLTNKSAVLYAKGSVAEAIEVSKLALSKYIKIFGEYAHVTVVTLRNVGYLIFKTKAYAAAAPYYEQLVGIVNANKSLELEEAVRMGFTDYGRLLIDSGGDLHKAAQMLLRSLDFFERSLGPNDIGAIEACHYLGILYKHHLKDVETARPYWIRAADGFRAAYGQTHANTINATAELSQCSSKVTLEGKQAPCAYCGVISPRQRCVTCLSVSYCSREHQRLDYKTHKTVCKPISPAVACSADSKAAASEGTGSSSPTSSESSATDSASAAIKDPSTMSIKELKLELTSAGLGSELARCNEKAELVALLQSHRQRKSKEETVEHSKVNLTASQKDELKTEFHRSYMDLVQGMAGMVPGMNPILASGGKKSAPFQAKLKQFYWFLLPKYVSAFGEESEPIPEVYGILANMFETSGASSEFTESLFRKALALKTKCYGPDHYKTLQTANQMGNQLLARGQADEARQLYERAYRGFLKLLGPDDYLTKSARMGVEMLKGNFDDTSGIYSQFTEALNDQVLKPKNERANLGPDFMEKTLQQLQDKMKVLNSMGYTDAKSCELALSNSRGDLAAAVALLEKSGGKRL